MNADVVVIGAGAAGLMCAAKAARRGRRVLLVDHWKKIGERIRVSGGGRCNFTNRRVGAEHYLSQNPHFCRSALARYGPADFVAQLERFAVPYEERDHGQLFCRRSAQDVTEMLLSDCEAAGVRLAVPCPVRAVTAAPPAGDDARFEVGLGDGPVRCRSLVIATGGLAVPQLGATPFGYDVAMRFGLRVVEPRPALVPLTFGDEDFGFLRGLAGVAFDSDVSCQGRADLPRFHERALITHAGLSGPAILQISSYWQHDGRGASGTRPVALDLVPGVDADAWLAAERDRGRALVSALAERLPRRLAQALATRHGWPVALAETSNRTLGAIARQLKEWALTPTGTLGFAKAEVTLGGVDTRDLSSQTMEAVRVPGLFFVGEVVDVTGWLGGYNFQWAWSSGWVAGQYC